MDRRAAAPALEGALALAAAMGIGRFAYTALLPVTQRALGAGDGAMGALASGNLAGYLAGVLLARQLVGKPPHRLLLRTGLVVTALAAGLGALGAWLPWWALLRFAAGCASGLVFVLASASALEAAPAHAGLLYSGVGLGIALSGTVAALVPMSAGFGPPWLVLALAAAALVVPALRHLGAPAAAPPASGGPSAGDGPHPSPQAQAAPALSPSAPGALRRGAVALAPLAIAYFLEGFGYIVSGTFAVSAVRRTPGLETLAPWTWVLTGLTAAPSALLWALAGRRLGLRGALALAHLAQAVGMALPTLSSGAPAALCGAALFGGTFIGITALAMGAARVLAPSSPGRLVGSLTAIYGVGQVLGPLFAGALSQRLGDPRPAVLGAAVAVALGGALLLAWPQAAAPDRSAR